MTRAGRLLAAIGSWAGDLYRLCRAHWRFGELATLAVCLALGASLVMGIPMVFGPNGSIDPYGYREYEEPETIYQLALSGVAFVGPVLIGALLAARAWRQRR